MSNGPAGHGAVVERFCGLNVKCLLLAHVFEYLVLNWLHCLGKLGNL